GLPKDDEKSLAEAPNYAAMFNRMAPEVGPDAAKDAGLKLLEWIGQLPEGGERNLATNITNGTMEQVLGKQKYQEALMGNVVAQSVARRAGERGEIKHGDEETVS